MTGNYMARLMCRHGLQIRPKHRYAATKDNDHDDVIIPNIA
jgi:hypothetical protein